ncbi:MAG: RsmE family RNA methyltransferase [Pseudobdellovibrionaceae bacterium]
MRRYWIESENIQDTVVILTDEVFHHIFDVCRQEVGSKFELLTEQGQALFVEVSEKNKKQAVAKILEVRKLPALPKPHLHLLLSIPRFPVFESILEKSVEMGVKSITPCFSDFSFIKSDDKLSDNKQMRWQKIIRSATQQTGRGDWMQLNPSMALIDAINQNKANPCLFAYEGPGVLSIKTFLQHLRQSLASLPEDIFVIVGSEGGFSDQEVAEFQQLGLHPVTLGAQVLRVETACMTLVSILKYDLDLI